MKKTEKKKSNTSNKSIITVIVILVLIIACNVVAFNSALVRDSIYTSYRNAKEVENYNTMRRIGGNKDLDVRVEDVKKLDNTLEYTVVYKLNTEDAKEYLIKKDISVDSGTTIYDSKNILYINKFNSLVNVGGRLDIDYYNGIKKELNLENPKDITVEQTEVSKKVDLAKDELSVRYKVENVNFAEDKVNIRIYNVNLYSNETYHTTGNTKVPYMQYPENEWQF